MLVNLISKAIRTGFWFRLLLLAGIVSAVGLATIHAEAKKGGRPVVVFSMPDGDITIELFSEKAPITVKNFLDYVESGFYDGTIFHRVIPGFVIQGGGFTSDMQQKTTQAAIKNEADNGLKNARGTLSMARTSDINSATSQFFVNLKDNANLDHGPGSFGYAVFGRVTDGMDVVDKIAAVRTTTKGHYQDTPVEAVVTKSAKKQE